MSAFCEDKINDGKIKDLCCPNMDDANKKCSSVIREKDLKIMGLSEEMIQKYTQFSISNAVDEMSDFGWCPQCNNPADLEPEKNRGNCTNCSFSFCIGCKEKYHYGKKCKAVMQTKVNNSEFVNEAT